MAYTREQYEKFLISTIKWIVRIPDKEVRIWHWLDKSVVPAIKISVNAGHYNFVLDEIPGNSYSMDVEVNGKKAWLTTPDSVQEAFSIRNQLLEQYQQNVK